ncbi:hypothetical protein RRG08_056050 [Elysia crispata]|uniref:Uncharacterized protein n=1 Tax=Elysia crispata TaxID=231223 RepID=A0AAE1DJC0_9GAST|nr:hypothetical protein RRG08_056050 [Elysia crispata]
MKWLMWEFMTLTSSRNSLHHCLHQHPHERLQDEGNAAALLQPHTQCGQMSGPIWRGILPKRQKQGYGQLKCDLLRSTLSQLPACREMGCMPEK